MVVAYVMTYCIGQIGDCCGHSAIPLLPMTLIFGDNLPCVTSVYVSPTTLHYPIPFCPLVPLTFNCFCSPSPQDILYDYSHTFLHTPSQIKPSPVFTLKILLVGSIILGVVKWLNAGTYIFVRSVIGRLMVRASCLLFALTMLTIHLLTVSHLLASASAADCSTKAVPCVIMWM